MANFNNMGVGKKFLNKILDSKGVKHHFSKKNFTEASLIKKITNEFKKVSPNK